MASRIGLIGIDVDGTLVGRSGVVPSQVWEVASAARERGIHLALCSGRPAFGLAMDYANQLDPGGWHVFQNGASVVHRHTGRSLSTPLELDAVTALVAHSRGSGAILELSSDSDYVTESDSSWAREHAKLLGVPFDARPYESLRGAVVRAQWLASHEAAKDLIDRAPPHVEIAQSSSPLMPHTQFVGITQQGVSKGAALRTVAAKYAIPLADVMYIGDSGNDLAALKLVGHPIAMANAEASVRAIAAHIIGHVDDGGIVEALAWATARGPHR